MPERAESTESSEHRIVVSNLSTKLFKDNEKYFGLILRIYLYNQSGSD